MSGKKLVSSIGNIRYRKCCTQIENGSPFSKLLCFQFQLLIYRILKTIQSRTVKVELERPGMFYPTSLHDCCKNIEHVELTLQHPSNGGCKRCGTTVAHPHPLEDGHGGKSTGDG